MWPLEVENGIASIQSLLVHLPFYYGDNGLIDQWWSIVKAEKHILVEVFVGTRCFLLLCICCGYIGRVSASTDMARRRFEWDDLTLTEILVRPPF